MKVRTLVFAFITAVVLTTALFAQTADEIAAAGTFDGQMYRNERLGLSILAPGGWSFFPYTRNQALVDKNRANNRTAAASNTQVLFQAAPSKLLGEEKSAIFSAGVQTGVKGKTSAQYATENRDNLAAQSGLTLVGGVYETKFGNTAFSVFEVTGKANGSEYRQVYLATVRKGVAIFFVETFYDNKNTFAAEASLKTIKFR